MSNQTADGYARLYHVSPERNFYRILRQGLVLHKASGKMRCIWLCSEDTLAWAIGHVAEHQGCDVSNMSIFGVTVPFYQIKRHRTGIYLCCTDVPRHQIEIVRESGCGLSC